MDERLIILPPWFCCRSVGMMALQSKKDPTSLTSMTRRKSSSLSSITGTRSAPRAMAALLTRMSMRPKASRVSCTIRVTSTCWLTSPMSARPRRPCASICSTVLCTSYQLTAFSSAGKVAGSRPVPVTTTWAPAAASATAVARPMPRKRPAPVTMATLPSSTPTRFSFVWICPTGGSCVCLYGTRQHGKGAKRTIRPGQHFDRMEDCGGEPVLRHTLTELEDAAGIPADDELRLHARQMRYFAVQEGPRSLWVQEVVDPSTAATPVAFGHFEHVQIWNLA